MKNIFKNRRLVILAVIIVIVIIIVISKIISGMNHVREVETITTEIQQAQSESLERGTETSEQQKVDVYFSNDKKDTTFMCSRVFPVEHLIAVSDEGMTKYTNTLISLIHGPTADEQDVGFLTAINPGVSIQKIQLSDEGVVTVDFSSDLGKGVPGSCDIQAIRAQIEKTLLQFEEVTSVIISIDGDSQTTL